MILSFTDVNRDIYGNRMLDMTEYRQQVKLMVRLLRKSEYEKKVRYNLTERAITTPSSITSGTPAACYRFQ